MKGGRKVDNSLSNKLFEVAERISELRDIYGLSAEEMAHRTEVSLEEYKTFEEGKEDMPLSFIHKCAKVFGIGKTDLLEGRSSNLSSYTAP